MYNINQFFLLNFQKGALIFILFILSCGERNNFDIDTTDSNINLKIIRFDKELFKTPADSLQNANDLFYKKYGTFYQLYIERVLNLGLVKDPVIGFHLRNFISSSDIKQIYADVQEKYKNLQDIETELTGAFRRYNVIFPDKNVPKLFSFISGLEYQNIVADSLIMIGLDMYLGTDYSLYQRKEFPLYKRKKMRKEYISIDCIKNWLASEIDANQGDKTLLNQMIYHGKILFLMDVLMTTTHDSLNIGYTSKELKWCDDNSNEIWGFFVENKLFFTKDRAQIIKYIGEGPFTKGFPDGSPAEIGKWLGWQIVKSYMKKHPDKNISDLIKETNSQHIFHESGYKP